MADETRSLLAHLFRRAAFGARKADLDTYSARGYDAAVTDLVTAKPASAAPAGATIPGLTGGMMGGSNNSNSVKQKLWDAQGAWVQSMVTSRAPLAERMTLFYADHFATAFNPGDHIDVPALTAQLALFRKFSLGSFKDLAHAMLDDLALACYLDSDANVKGTPNENLARETMELFTLGRGNYTETDVKELARSFTGYTVRQSGATKDTATYSLAYDSSRHDTGYKTVLGKTGAFTPHQALDVLLAHPAAPRFIADKLVATFLAPSNPSAVDAVSASLVANNWNVGSALRTLFTHPQFRSPSARETLVKSPAEYVVGLLRALNRTEYKPAALWIEKAGQSLFRPPNVGGWATGAQWLGAGGMLARYNAASDIGRWHAAAPSPFAPNGTDLTTWMEAFGMTSVAPSTQNALENYIRNTANLTPSAKSAGIITMLASTPDFNLA